MPQWVFQFHQITGLEAQFLAVGPDGRDQLLIGGPFEHIARGAHLEGRGDVLSVLVLGEDDDPALWTLLPDAARGHQAVQAGHGDVHQYHVGG